MDVDEEVAGALVHAVNAVGKVTVRRDAGALQDVDAEVAGETTIQAPEDTVGRRAVRRYGGAPVDVDLDVVGDTGSVGDEPALGKEALGISGGRLDGGAANVDVDRAGAEMPAGDADGVRALIVLRLNGDVRQVYFYSAIANMVAVDAVGSVAQRCDVAAAYVDVEVADALYASQKRPRR